MIVPLQAAVINAHISELDMLRDGFIAAARAALWPWPSNIGQPHKIISPQQKILLPLILKRLKKLHET